MNEQKLVLLYPQKRGKEGRARLDYVLKYALDGIEAEIYEDMKILWENDEGTIPSEKFQNRRLLFAVPLGKNGVNRGYYEILAWLRTGKQVLLGTTAGFLIDADSELFTKAAAKELAVAANSAGCAFVGRPLVEGTSFLDNYQIQASNMGTDKMGAYLRSARILTEQILKFQLEKKEHPHLLVLHASNHKTSNTMLIWKAVRERIEKHVEVREINLRNGTLEDCGGCPYQMCLHFGERGQCFYGGTIVNEVYPGVQWADGILLLCPNYNDALSANMTAFINRLTALFRATRFYDKAVFAIIVSGYSGSDLIAGQIAAAMNMNKTFYMPGNFCMMETGNDPGAVMRSDGIHDRVNAFADNIIFTLKY